VRSPLLAAVARRPLAAAIGLDPVVDERISEVDYGSWTGRKIVTWSKNRSGPCAATAQRGRLPRW